MIRQLLALLAILSGLGAAPVHAAARPVAVSEAGVEAGREIVVTARVQIAIASRILPVAASVPPVQARADASAVPLVQTIRVPVDRARE